MARIMIVEDDSDIRALLSQALALEDHWVVAVGHPANALTALEAGPAPDLILADLNMPYMTGAEFLKELRKNATLAKTRVALMSASRDVRGLAASLGADAAIVKPIDLTELLALVSRLCP